MWASLQARTSREYSLFDAAWFRCWESQLSEENDWSGPVRYCVVSDGDTAMGILPLAVQRKYVRILSLPGYYHPFRWIPVASGCGPVVASAMADLLEESCSGLGTRIGPTPADNPFVDALFANLRGRGWRQARFLRGDHMVLRLRSSLDAYLDRSRRRLWKRVASRKRRLGALGLVRVDFYTGLSSGAWMDVFTDIAQIEKNSTRTTAGADSHFCDAARREFWLKVATDPEWGGVCRTWIARVDGEPIAFDLAIDAGCCRYAITGAYASRYARFGPGWMTLTAMLEDAFVKRISTIDLGLGDPGYKAVLGARPEFGFEDHLALRPGLAAEVIHLGLRLCNAARIGNVALS